MGMVVKKNEGIIIVNADGGSVANGEKAVIVYNRSQVSGMGMIVFHYDQHDGSDISKFNGEVKDEDPTRVDMFDLL